MENKDIVLEGEILDTVDQTGFLKYIPIPTRYDASAIAKTEGIHPLACEKPDCPLCLTCSNPEVNPHCSVCKGAGFVHPVDIKGKPVYRNIMACTAPGCYTENRKHKQMEGFSPAARTDGIKKFSSFKNRKGTEAAFKYARALCTKSADYKPFLMISGGFGTGKTHLCQAVYFDMLEHNIPVKYYYMLDFLNDLKATIEVKGTQEQFIDSMKNIYCLILDDMDINALGDWTTTILTDIIDFRYEAHFPTVLTTNHDITQIPGRIQDRFLDIALSHCAVMVTTNNKGERVPVTSYRHKERVV